MKTKLLYFFILSISIQVTAQRRYLASQYFKEYAYVKASKLYEEIYKSGDSSQLVLERLGDSYYNNTDAINATIWFSKLINNYGNEIDPEYYFKYAQSLKSTGDYNKSDLMMEKFWALTKSKKGAKNMVINPDYVSLLTDNPKESLINLHNVSTNTEYSDFGNFVRNGKLYYASAFSSTGDKLYVWNDEPYLDIFESNITDRVLEGEEDVHVLELSDVNRLGSSVNTRFHESNVAITKDGQTMYFTRNSFDGDRRQKSKKRKTLLKLYKASLVDNQWENVEELPFNSNDYSTGHPALSVDEKTLYFISDKPGGFGHTDIYKVSIVDGEYRGVQNLGKEINTQGREMFPYISSKNVLYFSSDGHLGLGALDIFESKIIKETYSKPKNIEAPFNSKLDDFGFYISESMDQGFFSSNREGGKGSDDIYSFTISKPKPCTQHIAGVITDNKTNFVLPGAIIKLIDTKGMIIANTISKADGSYLFKEVPCTSNYVILAENDDYKSDKKGVITTDKRDVTQKIDLSLTPLIINNEIVINPIFFDFNKYSIRDEAAFELNYIVSVMNNHPEMFIKIESFTDSRGTKKYNQILSDNRAKSTRDYIISRGIPANRIVSAIGYGESRLLINCGGLNQEKCTEEDHQRNRRSKFIIVNGGNSIKVRDANIAPLKKIDRKPGRN